EEYEAAEVKKEKISKEMYYAKNKNFRVWLEERGLWLDRIESKKQKKMFSEFVRLWNSGSLSTGSYIGRRIRTEKDKQEDDDDGIDGEVPMTKHKWVFRNVDKVELSRVISDFGFAKKEGFILEQTYIAGTLPYMSPENFHESAIITQKVDIYALGITFYKIITHKYPVSERSIKEQTKKLAQMKGINRPPEIKDDILWDLLSKMLEFDTNKRTTAAQALQHPYFTSPEAITDISKEQLELAQQSTD
ncbi:MAG: hypothetical protein EZS28_030117, partial [Streblomastix strix]